MASGGWTWIGTVCALVVVLSQVRTARSTGKYTISHIYFGCSNFGEKLPVLGLHARQNWDRGYTYTVWTATLCLRHPKGLAEKRVAAEIMVTVAGWLGTCALVLLDSGREA